MNKATTRLLLALALWDLVLGPCTAQPAGGGAAAAGPAAPAAEPELPRLGTKSEALPGFKAVSTCVPLNLLIAPNATGGHSIDLEAQQEVLDALTYRVADNTLFLETTKNFSTSRPIKITVTLPPGDLQRVDHFGTGRRGGCGGAGGGGGRGAARRAGDRSSWRKLAAGGRRAGGGAGLPGRRG